MHPQTVEAASAETLVEVLWTEDHSVQGEALHLSLEVHGELRSLTVEAVPRPMVAEAASASRRLGGTVTAFPRESSHQARVLWPRHTTTSTRPPAPASVSARAPALTRTRTLRDWPRRLGG